jgi:hypothetical protein
MTTIIFDIDNTLSNATHREHWLASTPKNWEAFFSRSDEDSVIRPVADILYSLYNTAEYNLVTCTGRSEDYRDITLDWLQKHSMLDMFDGHYFRKSGDYRDDTVVKYEMLLEMRKDGYYPSIAFEDRQKVCAMWRDNGIFVFDVSQGKGNF